MLRISWAFQGNDSSADSLSRKDIAPTNPRGIPYAPFVDKVEDYVTSRADVESTLKNFQEMISYVSIRERERVGTERVVRKYQFMEANQQRRAAGLKDKMPDIQKTLDTVRFLKTRKVWLYRLRCQKIQGRCANWLYSLDQIQ